MRLCDWMLNETSLRRSHSQLSRKSVFHQSYEFGTYDPGRISIITRLNERCVWQRSTLDTADRQRPPLRKTRLWRQLCNIQHRPSNTFWSNNNFVKETMLYSTVMHLYVDTVFNLQPFWEQYRVSTKIHYPYLSHDPTHQFFNVYIYAIPLAPTTEWP